MARSHFRRYQEHQQERRLLLSLVGIIGVLAFLAFFGLKIFVGFSLLVERLRGGTPSAQPIRNIVLPPTLDPLPIATNSATVAISGAGTAGHTLILYVNDGEAKKAAITRDGIFTISSVKLDEGLNTVSAKQTDANGNISDLSNVLDIRVKRTPPSLDISSPSDNSTIGGDTDKVAVSGTTEEDASLTINGRLAVVAVDGSFRYDFPLSEGINTLTIVAQDPAGNRTTIERHVTYSK